MKKHISLKLAVTAILFVFAASCSHKVDYTVQQKQFTVSDSLITVKADYLEISSTSPKLNTWLDSINNAIYNNIIAQKDTIRKFSTEDRMRFRESWPPYELMVLDTVYLKNSNILSVLYTTYSFTGGAHGMTSFVGYNYDMVNQKELGVKDLFKPNTTEEINKILAEYFTNPDNCFASRPTLQLASAVNLAFESFVFTYEQYVLGAYACGPATVTVPYIILEKYLTNPLNLEL
ncbi:MAG: DUF3298 and DUF4163 domain-containing protein [Bacteroidales bacterium]